MLYQMSQQNCIARPQFAGVQPFVHPGTMFPRYAVATGTCIINPQCMHEGVVVSLCVYVFVYHASCYMPHFASKIRCLRFFNGVFQICNVWLLLRVLCSKVLVSFADHCGLPHSLTSSQWTKEPGMAYFQHEECVQLVIASTTQLTHH